MIVGERNACRPRSRSPCGPAIQHCAPLGSAARASLKRASGSVDPSDEINGNRPLPTPHGWDYTAGFGSDTSHKSVTFGLCRVQSNICNHLLILQMCGKFGFPASPFRRVSSDLAYSRASPVCPNHPFSRTCDATTIQTAYRSPCFRGAERPPSRSWPQMSSDRNNVDSLGE
jgi:hypothetical protein